MSDQIHTVVLVLKDGKGFSFRDVTLITNHINNKWKSDVRPRIICLWNKASQHYDLGSFELMPLENDWPGTWSRMILYSPEMEQYRPFLYVDLDTAVIDSLENIFELVKNPAMFITLEDFYQEGKLATGLVWIPAGSNKIRKVWKAWKKDEEAKGSRMDNFLRKVIVPDAFWQNLTNTIHDFKPRKGGKLTVIPKEANLICFHGRPRIHDTDINWVKDYVNTDLIRPLSRVTVIIPYKTDRGWLKDAINSVPKDVQLLVSQGEGGWPANFNKVLDQATGDYIKYLHEDDMLTENCIRDSVQAMEDQGADFIHGDVIEVQQGSDAKRTKRPSVQYPTIQSLKKKNVLHSATLMYRREVFEKLGNFDESLNMCEEYEFNLRCLQAGMKIGYCPSVLAIYRRHPAQKIRTESRSVHKTEREMVNAKYK